MNKKYQNKYYSKRSIRTTFRNIYNLGLKNYKNINNY